MCGVVYALCVCGVSCVWGGVYIIVCGVSSLCGVVWCMHHVCGVYNVFCGG